jgi:type IV secretion system protein VirD4
VVVFLRRLCAPIFVEGAFIAASGGFIAIAVAIGMSVWRAREAKNVETYGSARWATSDRKSPRRTARPDGVVLGKLDATICATTGRSMCCASRRPAAARASACRADAADLAGQLAIVHDIKGENWELTAGFRARHGRVLLFDPTNPASSAYNPLLEVRRGEWEVRDVQNIADILVDPEGSLERRNHWEKTSHSLLVGAILHVLYAESGQDAGRRRRLPVRSEAPDRDDAARDDDDPHLGERAASRHRLAARELLNKSDNERSGVLSTAMSFLGLYRDPVVAEVTRAATGASPISSAAKRPTTLYLVVPPSDINRTKPLIRLMLNQIGRRLTEELHAKGGGIGCC